MKKIYPYLSYAGAIPFIVCVLLFVPVFYRSISENPRGSAR